MLFLFFKQKTAYEMRISDWSSDVCSSDLANGDILNNSCAGWRRHSNHTPFCLWRLTSGFHPIPDIGQAPLPGPWDYTRQIGRASCRERVCPYVTISEVAVY